MEKKVIWYKIKNWDQKEIKEPEDLENLLDQGFTVVKEIRKGNEKNWTTYSPLTREEALEEHKKRWGNLPF